MAGACGWGAWLRVFADGFAGGLAVKESAIGLEVGGELEDSFFCIDALLWSVKGVCDHGDTRNGIGVDASRDACWCRDLGFNSCAEGLGWIDAGCSAVCFRDGFEGELSVSLVKQLHVLVDGCFDVGAFCLIAAGCQSGN